MEKFEQALEGPGDEMQIRDRAVTAFLFLGEKLRMLAESEFKPGARRRFAGPADPDQVSRTIEGEIIPRLLLAHREIAEPVIPRFGPTLTVEDYEQIVSAALRNDGRAIELQTAALMMRGVTREDLLLDLIPAAARRLGEMWERDECDFTDITIGLCRLHEAVRENTRDIEWKAAPPAGAPRILMATAGGDQHTLGIVIAADFFRRAGWRVTSEFGANCPQLCEFVREEQFDVVGLSCSCEAKAVDVASEIGAIRAASRNKLLKILVGGRLVVETPGFGARVGADVAAIDAKGAPALARSLLAAPQVNC